MSMSNTVSTSEEEYKKKYMKSHPYVSNRETEFYI